MRFIGGVIEKLQRHPKRIVFPEGCEPRVLQAARQFYSLRLGVPILLGDRIAVMSARPGRIVADVRITLGRPRSVRALQKDPAYHELYSNVWTKLEEGLSP